MCAGGGAAEGVRGNHAKYGQGVGGAGAGGGAERGRADWRDCGGQGGWRRGSRPAEEYHEGQGTTAPPFESLALIYFGWMDDWVGGCVRVELFLPMCERTGSLEFGCLRVCAF